MKCLTILSALVWIVLTDIALAETYVAAYGGANFESVDYSFGPVTISDRTGFVIGANVGTTVKAVPGLRIEGDLSFRGNPVEINIACCGGLNFGAHDETWALLGNAVYDFQTSGWPVHPYVLAGAGYASRTASLDAFPFELSNQGFAWQAGAGLNTVVADGVMLGIGYRYFDAPNIGFGSISNDGINHSVLASATFSLGE